MHKERLRKVCEVLKDVKPKLFAMGTWIERNNQTNCTTAACAIGWAAQHPWFIAQGLELHNRTPVYKEFHDYQAVAEFFDLSYTEAEYLFSPIAYKQDAPPTTVVRRRIERFIAEGEMDPKVLSRLLNIQT